MSLQLNFVCLCQKETRKTKTKRSLVISIDIVSTIQKCLIIYPNLSFSVVKIQSCNLVLVITTLLVKYDSVNNRYQSSIQN